MTFETPAAAEEATKLNLDATGKQHLRITMVDRNLLAAKSGAALGKMCEKYEFCIKNETLSIKNKEFCIQNGEFCSASVHHLAIRGEAVDTNRYCALKTRNLALKTRNLAF